MLKFSILLLMVFISVYGVIEPMSENIKTLILKHHNDLRSQVAKGKFFAKPKATNMRKLIWNHALCDSAARYAEQLLHTRNYTIIDSSISIYHSSTFSTLDNIVRKSCLKWRNELRFHSWNHQNISDLMVSFVNNGFQMIHATSFKVGCAHVKWYENVKNVNYPNELLVCVYNGGRFDRSVGIYEEGQESCSNCPRDTECETSSGLCVGITLLANKYRQQILNLHKRSVEQEIMNLEILYHPSPVPHDVYLTNFKWDDELARNAHNLLLHYIFVSTHQNTTLVPQIGTIIYTNLNLISNNQMINDSFNELMTDNEVQKNWANRTRIGCAIKAWRYNNRGELKTSLVYQYDPPLANGTIMYSIQ